MKNKRKIRAISLILCMCTLQFVMMSCKKDVENEKTDTTDITTPERENSEVTTSNSGIEDEEKNILYNGIELPKKWPPDSIYGKVGGNPTKMPYLIDKKDGGIKPDIIDISVGRQLFVDDFLIDSTTLDQTFHKAVKYRDNPIVVPTLPSDGTRCMLAGGGVWYDESEKLFKMWYLANWANGVAYATSRDGINFDKPQIVINNIVYNDLEPDSTTVWIDKNAENSDEKYVMFIRTADSKYGTPGVYHPGYIYTSPDGIKWKHKVTTGDCGDRSTLFYNAFTDKWCFSIRTYINHLGKKTFRGRKYFEADNLKDFTNSAKEAVNWIFSDKDDKYNPEYLKASEIYCVDAIAYESVMLSAVEIFEGPDNALSNTLCIPKATEINVAFSRDGFNFDRSFKEPFIEASFDKTKWDQGYLSPAGGVCVVVGDKLYFYYSAFQASSSNAYENASIGLATLRRDGFVSLDGSGEVLTETLKVDKGRKYLFVNAKCDSIKAEILDGEGKVLDGYSLDDCIAFSGDSTCKMIEWKNGKDLSVLDSKEFKIRFVTENGEFYSFWLSDTKDGDSHGYYAAGIAE